MKTLVETHESHQGFSDHLEEKSDLDFFRNLRVSKDTYNLLLDIIEEHHTPVYRGGTPPVSSKLCLQLGLWYLGHTASYQEIAELFDLSKSAVFNSVQTFINIIHSIGGKYIQWPNGDHIKEVEKRFQDIAGFPGVVGALDGCHVEIKAPEVAHKDFFIRKDRHAVGLHLMAICNHQKVFTFIDVGFPGSAHDSRVFKECKFCIFMTLAPESVFPSKYYHIIGDSAFQHSNYLQVPFKNFGNLSRPNGQKKFNAKLSQTRGIIKKAFNLLKGRFRRLKYIDADIKRIQNIVIAACVLHNIALKNPVEEELLLNELGETVDVPQNATVQDQIQLPDFEGLEKRHVIASIL